MRTLVLGLIGLAMAESAVAQPRPPALDFVTLSPPPGAPAAAVGPPISNGVVVPAGYETFYLSGIPSNVAGGTEAQTAEVLNKLGAVLKARGYGFGDVVNAKVYLVGDPARGGAMDFAGMNAAFRRVFGTAEQPNKPSRVTVQIAGLAMPNALVEIELTAARPPRR